MAGEMEPAEQHTHTSNSTTALDPTQQQPADDPDITEDEMDDESGPANSSAATGEGDGEEADGENEQSNATADASSSSSTPLTATAATKRAPPRKRKVRNQGWGHNTKKKKMNNAMRWQEKKARLAAEKAAAAAAATTHTTEPPAPAEETEAAEVTTDEPTVKQEQLDETMEGEAVSSSAPAVDEVVEKTERGRPLRASIKARQKQLEEERRQEEEGRQRRRQEKLLAQARSKTRVKKEEPATPTSTATLTSTQPLSLSAQQPPLSSLSSLPSSSSSSSYPPPPPPPPALLSVERDKSRVLPSHCYGVDWRCVAKLTDCVYTQLHATRSSVIDWSTVSAMMANVSPLSSDECRLLWRCVAYGMDDDGYGRWKRLEPEYEADADSDIDVELPGYDESGLADIRTVIKSSQMRQCEREDTVAGWTTQHDCALLNVLAVWGSKSRQQQQAHTATPTPAPHIALSLTAPPLSTATTPHLPSVASDWQYIADLFQQFAATHKSPTFLQARFATLTRMALTVEGTGSGVREERVRLRERVLAVLGVSEGVEGREWLLHSGGRNWDENREVVDRRLRTRRKQQRKNAGAGDATNGKKQPVASTSHTDTTTVSGEAESGKEERSEISMDAATASMTVDKSSSAQSHDGSSSSMDGAAEGAEVDTASSEVDPPQAVTAEMTANNNGSGSDAAEMELTESAAITVE